MQNKITMKEFVIGMLKEKLPANYYYHNYHHTLYVQEKAIEIGTYEGCTEKEIELLSAAALWHDTGYINIYTGHEEASCLLAKKHLPQYGFSEKDIDKIIGMVMATKILQAPKNKLEEILADADLEYLGTADAAKKAHLLFRELQSLSPSLTIAAWDRMQIAFLETHHYFTNYCKVNRDPMRHAYHKKLIGAVV
jgi:uncharacterized protein